MISNSIKKYKIDIGSHPDFSEDSSEIYTSYDKIINVSDDPFFIKEKPLQSGEVFWFPIIEFGAWTYMPFYWITHILDEAINRNSKIYVHCHAGAHRSPIIIYIYLKALGYSPNEALLMMDEGFKPEIHKNWAEQILDNDIEFGRIPLDAVEFIKDVRKDKTKSLMEVMCARNVLDLPQKTIDNINIRKPVTKKQIELDNKIKF